MSKFLSKIKQLLINWYYWTLDYIYVGFWQVLGFMRHGDSQVFLKPENALQKTPVILIPGIYERWEFMKPIAVLLFDAGYTVHIVEGLGYNRGTVEDMARVIYEYTEEHNIKSSLIVAHSKGGLIGKYLLIHDNDHRFKGMVALNAPFTGSKYASFLPLKSVRIFMPDSPLLKQLAVNSVANEKIVSIFGIFDPHIPHGSFLKGAKNIRLRTYGHFRTIKDKKVHKEILRSLEDIDKDGG
jgi:triacylglycerol lipase